MQDELEQDPYVQYMITSYINEIGLTNGVMEVPDESNNLDILELLANLPNNSSQVEQYSGLSPANYQDLLSVYMLIDMCHDYKDPGRGVLLESFMEENDRCKG